MKKIVSLLLSFFIILAGYGPAYGELAREDRLIEEDGCLYYPIRDISEEFGYGIEWLPGEKQVLLTGDGKEYRFGNTRNYIESNGRRMDSKTGTIIRDGKFYVSLELLSRLEDLVVGYDGKRLNIRRASSNKEEYFQEVGDEKTYRLLDSYLKDMEEGKGFSGNVLISKDGKILLNKSYGYANHDQKISNHSQGNFAIASMTKQFTALAIMQLEEEGLLSLDDRLSKYFPEIKNSDEISIHNMLTHSSGLNNITNQEGFFFLDHGTTRDEDLISMFKDLDLEFKPGEFFNYSNTNYYLLGKIIEDISGLTYEEYMEKNIFNPLGMKDTGVFFPQSEEQVDTQGHTGYLEVKEIDDSVVVKLSGGAGNIYSTVEDLYRWDQALRGEKILGKESIDRIFKENEMIVFGTELPIKVGYGWFIDREGRAAHHGGNTLGYTSEIRRGLDLDEARIILSNLGYYNLGQMMDDIESIMASGQAVEVEKHIEKKPSDYNIYDDYIGRYKIDEGMVMTVKREGKKLSAQMTGQESFQIFPMGEDRFFAKIADVEIQFNRNDENEIDSLVISQLGLKLSGERID